MSKLMKITAVLVIGMILLTGCKKEDDAGSYQQEAEELMPVVPTAPATPALPADPTVENLEKIEIPEDGE